MSRDAAAVLAETEFFGVLDRDVLQTVAARMITRRYRKGAILFHEGDPAETLLVVSDGLVKIFVSSASGDELVLATLPAGRTFGEVALFDKGPRSASAQALEATTLLALHRDHFVELMRDHPPVMEGLHRSIGSLFRRLLEQASDLAFLDLHGRVAKVLLELAGDRGDATGAEVTLDLMMSQADLAAMVGGSRPMVNRILKHFEERGYLEVQGRRIVIKDMVSLDRRAAT